MRIGANPFADLLAQELADSRRVAARTDLFTAFVPFAARWPVEMHVYPNRLVANLIGLDDAELDGSAQTLSRYPSTVRPAVSHPAALHFGTAQYADTEPQREGYFHVELKSVRRSATKLKFLAGSESAMDAFISDVTPESVAERLCEV